MQKICQIIKSFSGDIFGGYMRDKFCEVECRDIDCRLDPNLIRPCLQVLSIDFQIIELPLKPNYKSMNVYCYHVRDKTGFHYRLDILSCSFHNWHTYPCDFDTNLVAENNICLFIRPNLSMFLTYSVDVLNTTITRCKNKTFALVDLPSIDYTKNIIIILRSYDLVKRGWRMDDFYLGKYSWIFAKWSDINKHPEMLRLTTDESIHNIMSSQNECALCQEQFKDDDIVFNSCCNHNFHWNCSNDFSSGIMNWFTVKQKFSCPYCRQDAIKTKTSFITQYL